MRDYAEIAKILSEALTKSDYSYTDLVELTKIPRSALHRYISGETENMPIDRFQSICKVLGLVPEEVLGWVEPGDVLCVEPEPECVDTPVTRIYNRLNTDGQREYIRYGNYLCTCDEYKADELTPVTYIRHYFTAAAAGYAAPIEGEDFELIPVNDKTPVNADFCIDIAGDSMEPYIHDGQRVYVTRDINSLQEFDVGVFYVDGDVYCKQWCVDYVGSLHLLSANENREDANLCISKDSTRNVVCFGKVILPKRLPRPMHK